MFTKARTNVTNINHMHAHHYQEIDELNTHIHTQWYIYISCFFQVKVVHNRFSWDKVAFYSPLCWKIEDIPGDQMAWIVRDDHRQQILPVFEQFLQWMKIVQLSTSFPYSSLPSSLYDVVNVSYYCSMPIIIQKYYVYVLKF